MKNYARPLLFSLLLLPFCAQADSVRCHLTYGGETQVVEAEPVLSPYGVQTQSIGSYFLFRIVFQTEPSDLASIKLYTYVDRNTGPAIIHQASFPYPTRNAAVNGFSGQHFVYEPVRDSELQYWCELKTEAAAK